ncbi:MAG TPA: recombination protein RecR [Lentisphaeria bacterium]|nr:recombination protein RecR [Lentisphaeria bacterium]
MMEDYPKALQDLAHSLKALPGIGQRTAERLAIALLDWDETHLYEFSDQLRTLKSRVTQCTICGNLAEGAECRICRNPARDHKVICVVESARQIPVVEKCRRFAGLYHVLGGRVSPLDGVEFRDLNVETLFKRISEHSITELIIATSPDVEGEATATYLGDETRRQFDIKISRISLGVPVGSDLTFADSATMAMAIDNRQPLV